MPFTVFHLGPALALGLPLRRYIHAPTFILANVLIDIEPLLVLALDLNYPLHGYLHTLLFASMFGAVLGYATYLLEKVFRPLYRALHLVPVKPLKIESFIVAGVSGSILHVLLDSPLYHDIKPFYPIAVNPLLNPSLTRTVYYICMFTGLIGIAYYIHLLLSERIKLSLTRIQKN
uniref:Hydrolase n=1 Tax=Ignisphaera aggregans TaxID=334771 RepID=A0A7J3Z5T1_9CREN